jgi:phosphatidylglycerophosphate synthase
VNDLTNRRPVKSRATGWASALAQFLAKGGVSPDLISASGIAFALLGGAAFAVSGQNEGVLRGALLLLGAVCIQLRLLCNVMDGMVAVEHGKGGPLGPIWNELPDRASDVLLLVGAGYGAQQAGPDLGVALGWLTAVLAVSTAYVRELGRALGQSADFSGPLAKPQRMALLTALAVVSVIEGAWGWQGETLLFGLGVAAVLTGVTVFNRVRNLARGMKAAG